MNPTEIEGDIRHFETMIPPASFNTTYIPPTPSLNLQGLGEFMRLLNEKYPIDRSLGNFGGNHSVVFDTSDLNCTPALVVTVRVWKWLAWRNYPVRLSAEDLALSPEALVAEIDHVLKPQLEKLMRHTEQADQAEP